MSSESRATPTVKVSNERTRVTEWRFPPGAATSYHRHEYDYVVVPLMDGRLKLVTEEGETIAELKASVPYFRTTGVEHDVVNVNDFEYAFVEIEIK